MMNGLFKGRQSVFLYNGSIVYQGFNSIHSNKIIGYVRIDHRYVCMSEDDVDFTVTEETLRSYVTEREKVFNQYNN